MRAVNKIAMWAILTCVMLFVIADQALKRNLKTVDFGPLSELFKARLGEAVTVPVVSVSDVKSDAQLFDTYTRAFRVTVFVKENRLGGQVPESTEGLQGLSRELRLDAWGRPFCFVNSAGRIVVLSAGPSARESPDCKEMVALQREISAMESGKLYRYPSGRLLLVVVKE